MTKAMECYGLAIGGTLKARHYANPRNNVPAVQNPFMNALFATTASTLLDALTSAEVVDGSLNRIPIVPLDPAPPLRDLEDIYTGPLPDDLAERVQRVRMPQIEEIGNGSAGPFGIKPTTLKTFRDLQHADLANQSFKIVTVDPSALAILNRFRVDAAGRVHAGDKLGPLWARAFEHATRIAGVVAVGEACVDFGPLIVSRETARWAVDFISHCFGTTTSQLYRNLADTEGENVRNLIMRSAIRLRDKALADADPILENTAPLKAQQQIRDLKTDGWFSKRDLIRQVMHGGRASRDVKSELKTLLQAEAISCTCVSWKTSTGTWQKREFFTWLGDDD